MAVLPAAHSILPRDSGGGGPPENARSATRVVEGARASRRLKHFKRMTASTSSLLCYHNELRLKRPLHHPASQGGPPTPAIAGAERQALSFSRKARANAEQRTPRKTSLQTRREAERREAHQTGAASTSDAARTLSPVPLAEGLRSPGPQKMERARSPFGAPPRHPRFF